MRKIALIETNALSLSQKDIILNKINELSQDFHFIKFNVISNGETTLSFDRKTDSEDTVVDNIKKVNYFLL